MNEFRRPRPLGRKRDHADRVVRRVDQILELGDFGIAEPCRVVRAAPLLGDERALEVDAHDPSSRGRRAHGTGQRVDRGEQLVGRRRHGGCEQRGRSVATVIEDRLGVVLGVGACEVAPAPP